MPSKMYFKNLRKLYGRVSLGNHNRVWLKFTMTPETVDWLRDTVDYRRGGEGSATMELGTRLLLALAREGNDIDQLAIELEEVVESPYFIGNLTRLLRLMETKL